MSNNSGYFKHRIFSRLIVLLVLVTLFPLQPAVTYAAPAAQDGVLPACMGAVDIPIVDPPCKDIQIVFIIDDSGSMGRAVTGNDLNGLRFESMIETVDRLADFYLNELEARSRVLPKINIAAIHFATQIDFNSGWVQIAPRSRASWERPGGEREILINEKLINENIRSIVYNVDRERRTDFRNPFREAADLLSEIQLPDTQGCPNRLVFVLTDGAPDEGQGELHRFTPLSRAKSLLDAHFAAVREQAVRIESPIYVLAFRHSDRSYWDATEAYWKDGIATDALQVEVGNRGDTGALPNLLDIVRVKVEQSLVGSTYNMPAYLEGVELTYLAPNARARLQILDPQGNLLVPDGVRVILAGEGTVDQVWKILDTLPGEYVFKPLDEKGEPLPGGSLNLRFIYPDVEGMQVAVSSPHLQLFTRGDVRFQLQDEDGNPIQFHENELPRFSITFSLAGGEPQHMDIQPEEDEFVIPDLLPVSPGSGNVDVSVVTRDFEGNECLLYKGGATEVVDPVFVIAQPVDLQVCTPSEMPVRFPLTLVDINDNPTSISLPVSWQVTPVHEKGAPVTAEVHETSTGGKYEFRLDTQQAGNIVTTVTGDVEYAGETYQLYQETFETTGLVQDRTYAFKLMNVATTADTRSVKFNQWFGRVSQTPYGQLLIGRRWFNWRGPQEIRVSGRFTDQEAGANVPGIERYLVELVPAGGGVAVTASDRWREAGDGEYFVTYSAPPLGDYDVVITDRGAVQACTQVAPVSGTSITLIRHYWEYLFLILIFFLLLILLIILILWLLCLRSKPLVLYLEGDEDLLDAPTKTGAHIVARLDSRHALTVIEDAVAAIRNVKRQQGWLHVFTQVEGYVATEQVCNDDGQAVLKVSGYEHLTVYADASMKTESLLDLSHTTSVTVLEQHENCLRVKVAAVGYVDACTVQPPKRQLRIRCRRRPLVVTGQANDVLHDAPIRSGSFEVAVLRADTRLTVLEHEVQALDKIERAAAWLLVQTRLTGFVEPRYVNREAGDVVLVEPGGCVEVRAQASTDSNSLLGLVHAARVKVLAEADGWLKVAVLAQGYLPASRVKEPSKATGSRRQDRPLIETGPVKTVECPPEKPDDLKLIEGIGPKVEALLNEKGIYTFAQIAAETPAFKEIRRWFDDLGWYFMLPDTWPEQARLADQAKRKGQHPSESSEFNEYKAYLRAGRIPEPDDLERIEGIGPKVKAMLKEYGIETYGQLAGIGDSVSVIKGWLDKEGLSAPLIATWPEQARLAAARDWEGLENYKQKLRAE